eukprot:4159511-Pleurochrysis_carterae.AAC.3
MLDIARIAACQRVASAVHGLRAAECLAAECAGGESPLTAPLALAPRLRISFCTLSPALDSPPPYRLIASSISTSQNSWYPMPLESSNATPVLVMACAEAEDACSLSLKSGQRWADASAASLESTCLKPP